MLRRISSCTIKNYNIITRVLIIHLLKWFYIRNLSQFNVFYICNYCVTCCQLYSNVLQILAHSDFLDQVSSVETALAILQDACKSQKCRQYSNVGMIIAFLGILFFLFLDKRFIGFKIIRVLQQNDSTDADKSAVY